MTVNGMNYLKNNAINMYEIFEYFFSKYLPLMSPEQSIKLSNSGQSDMKRYFCKKLNPTETAAKVLFTFQIIFTLANVFPSVNSY